jgi:two-component system sensor histidine kinase MtrB
VGGIRARVRSHRRPPDRPHGAAWLFGLRTRLVLAFVLVALVSGVGAAAASYRSARNAVLDDAQKEILNGTFLPRVDDAAGRITYPPDEQTLDDIAGRVPNGVAVFGTLAGTGGSIAADQIPPELRRSVREGAGLRWMRVTRDGEPFLAYGTVVLSENGLRSGLEVYGLSPLAEDLGPGQPLSPQTTIDRLATEAAKTLALSLLVAVVLGLVAARGVLRPVREVRKGARRLAAGKLDTRLRARGSDELAELVRTFNTTAAALEGSVDELRRMEANARRFVADVSHELRTPLAAMTAVTDTLDEEAALLGADGATAARLISGETRKLVRLVENLIEISRFDAGRAELRLAEVDVAAVITAGLAARGWTDQVRTDLAAGITARLDRRRLDVIVANLVGNAVKHGGPPVVVELRTAGADPPDQDRRDRRRRPEQPAPGSGPGHAAQVVISVRDSGPGLAPEIRPHVFERFYKADSARTRSEGSGLGLAIARENAQLHGGVIEAADDPAGGARFTVRLPLLPPDPGEPG